MRKMIFLFFIAAMFCCCSKRQDQNKDGTLTEKDSVKPMVGHDFDERGCKASAGYTWSQVKQECVRIFEAGKVLNPYMVKQQSGAYIIEGDQAEIFLPSEKKSILLKRQSEGEPFVNGDWQLIPWKGYVLKKGEEILFTAQ